MKRTVIFRVLTLLYLAAVALLCFGKFDSLPHASTTILGLAADKIVHFSMFLPFPLLTYFSLRTGGRSVLGVIAVMVGIFVAGCLLAAATEYIQGMLPYRTMDPADFAADSYGLVCGCLVSFLVTIIARKKKYA